MTFGWGPQSGSAGQGAIYWHHQTPPYTGPHAIIIEACRKADWIDASMGVLGEKGSAKNDPDRRGRFSQLRFP